MSTLQARLDGIRNAFARLVAVSPRVPEKNAEVKRDNRLGFPVLSDPGNAYARQLGLVFTLPDDVRAIYESFGIVLPDFNGDDSWKLPIPARLVLDGRGVIRSIEADPDYTRRPEPEATLEVLRGPNHRP
jgi:peroxiredoxin